MKFWICGNSHTGALKKGLEILAPDDLDLTVFPLGNGHWETTPFSNVKDNMVFLSNAKYAENMLKWTGARRITRKAVWGFCMGTHNARIYRQDFWIKAEPSHIAEDHKRPISQGLLDSVILADQFHIREFLGAVKALGIRSYVISCPPPRDDHPCIGQGVRRETVAAIDQRARSLIREWLNTQGIDFIDYPKETRTPDGFLKEKFQHLWGANGTKDHHHANAEYGALMMKQVLEHIRQRS